MSPSPLVGLFVLLLAALASGFPVGVQLSSVHPAVINFTVSNPSNTPVQLLTYGTPLEGDLYGPIFRISDNQGMEIRYIGKVARRVWPASLDSYVTIQPSESISQTINLLPFYDFPEEGGKFLIEFVIPQFVEDLTWIDVSPLTFIAPPSSRSTLFPEPASTNCKSNELTQINAAVSGAKVESKAAYNCMNAGSCSTLATRWFGAYSSARYDYDKQVYNKVYNRLNSNTFNAYCNPAGCSRDTYAYVYPGDPNYTVYLCGAFWSQANERVNTIVHEMSHFTTLGGTDDFTYGKTSCLNLARTSPAKASRNADNVCYFSEEAARRFL